MAKGRREVRWQLRGEVKWGRWEEDQLTYALMRMTQERGKDFLECGPRIGKRECKLWLASTRSMDFMPANRRENHTCCDKKKMVGS